MSMHRLLIMDGHGSHVTAEFILSCWARQIVPLCLPPHRSHLLQPLDVSCFRSLKHYHSLAVMNTLQQRTLQFDKVEFLAQFPTIRAHAFRSSNILSAFKSSGLVPFRPHVVLSQLSP